MLTKFKQILSQRWRGALAGALFGAILSWAAFLELGAGLAHLSYDLPFRFRGNLKADDVAIIYMDDVSRAELQQPAGGTWSRGLHAKLIDQLRLAGARLIVLDILMTEKSNEADDRAFAAALGRATNVIIVGNVARQAENMFHGGSIEAPFREFADRATGWGLDNFSEDSDRCNRRHPLADDQVLPVSVVAARAVKPSIGAEGNRWMNYYGPPRWIPHHSYAAAYGTNASPTWFANKVVFIGAATQASVLSAQLEDYPTPFTRWTGEQSPGVEIHATAFLNLIHDEYLRRLPTPLECLMLAAAGALAGFGLVLLSPGWATLAVVAMAMLAFQGYWLLWARGIWFAWLVFVALQLPATLIWGLTYNGVRLHIDKRLLQESLTLHLSPARVAQILARPELLKPGAEKQDITIMFTDIANFSKMSSRMEADDLFKLLNEYFERALTVIHQHDGTVVKLIGDSIFAIWNAPFIQPDQQFRAAEAALKLQASIIQLEAQQRSVPLRTRIGIHTGSAFVGNVGSTERFDYTAIGDNINLASRLEGLNKHLGTDILMTRDLQKIISTKVTTRKVGYFRFKGQDRVIEIHEAVGGSELAEATRGWRDQFDGGLFAFQRKDWNAAEKAFKSVLEARPEDGPSLFYLDRILEFRQIAPPPDWTGEIEMREK